MARWWQYLAMVAGGVAIAAPVHVNFGHGSSADLQLMPSSAFAKAGGGGNGNSGNGNGGGRGGDGNGGASGNGGGGKGGDGNGGTNGNGGGNGNSGNGNGGGKGGNGNSGASGNGAGNSSSGNSGANGNGNGNSGSKGNSPGGAGNGNGSAGNAGNGNAGKGSSGASNGASSSKSGSSGNSSAGNSSASNSSGASNSSAGNSSGSSGRGGNQGAGGRSIGSASSGRANAAPGWSGQVPGLSKGIAKEVITEERKTWSGNKVKKSRPEAVYNAKAPVSTRSTTIGKKDKVSSEAKRTQAAKGGTARSVGRVDPGSKARSTPEPGKSSRAGRPAQSSAPEHVLRTSTDDRIVPTGTPSKPRQALNSIVVSGLSEQALAKLGASGLHVTSQTRGLIASRIVRLSVPRGMSALEARRAVKRLDGKASADMDTYYYTDGAASECSDPGCQASVLVGWTPPAVAACGEPPLIGLIDTGIDVNHEALRSQSIEILNGSSRLGNKSSLDHGTAIAALLVGRAGSETPGLIPQARLVAVDAFAKEDGMADRADVLSLVGALEALAERGVKVVNLSLSGPPNEVLRTAVEAARKRGIVLVAAVGNNGAGAEPSYPAAYPGVIAVTAVDRQLNAYRRATHGSYVAFAAPGVEIRTAQSKGGSAARSGTSYAVPFVSAAMAMMRAANPGTDIAELQKQLQDNTQDLGIPGRDTTFGHGLIQMTSLCSVPEAMPVPVAGGMSSVAPLRYGADDAP